MAKKEQNKIKIVTTTLLHKKDKKNEQKVLKKIYFTSLLLIFFSNYRYIKNLTLALKLINLTFTWTEFRQVGRIRFMVFNTTFNNISIISWQSVLLMEETGVL